MKPSLSIIDVLLNAVKMEKTHLFTCNSKKYVLESVLLRSPKHIQRMYYFTKCLLVTLIYSLYLFLY